MAELNHTPELGSLSYYHKDLKTIDDVKVLMINYLGKDGAFLVRNSFSRPGCLTVSVMHDNGIKHFNLGKQNNEYYVQDVRFCTISDLIVYYGRNDVPNQECVKHVRLTYPILNRQSLPLPGTMSSTMSLPRSISSSHSSSAVDSLTLLRDTSTLPRKRDSEASSTAEINHARHKSVPELQLPRPPKPLRGSSLDQHSPKQKSFFRLFRGKKKSHEEDSTEEKDSEVDGQPGTGRLRTVSDSSISEHEQRISTRPPVPLPPEARKIQEQKAGDKYQYESVRDTEQNRLKELIQTLKSTDMYGQNFEKCECGLSFDESELPRGWSMHISHDKLTNGRLFFMGPNKETAWNLPLDVSLELSPDQQEHIRDLLERSDHPPAHSGGADSGESQMGSLPSAPINYSTMSTTPATGAVLPQLPGQLASIDEWGGASSVTNSLPQAARHATQHNEHTGSTESPCLGVGCNMKPS